MNLASTLRDALERGQPRVGGLDEERRGADRRADGRAETVRMVLDHSLVKDDYVLAYDWQPTTVSWNLVGALCSRRWTGRTRCRPTATGTNVTYSLSVDVNMPMIGMFRRKAEKTIIDGALKGLKKRVEG